MSTSATRQWTGTWIPREIWITQSLTWMEKCLWAEISNLDGGQGCFASNDYLAEKMGSSTASIANMISKLRRLGFIKDAGFDGRRRHIRAVNPDLTLELTLIQSGGEGSINPPVNIDKRLEKRVETNLAEPVGTAVETVKKPATQPRQPNPLLEALASIGGANPRETPPSRWSAIQKYLREIKSVTPDVTPEEIKRRERDYLRKYPNATVTPDALAKHWGALAQGHQPAGTRVQSIPALPEPPNWQAIIDREFPDSSFASAHSAGGRKWSAMSAGDRAAVTQAVKPFLS